MNTQILRALILLALSLPQVVAAQVNSGSNGSDGAFHPTQNVTIDMNLRPDGIYHYTSVTIPAGVTVTFTPNANNTPVVWLVQGDCVIGGTIDIKGKNAIGSIGGTGGPGGFAGGNGGEIPSLGLGPGGGQSGFGGAFATAGYGDNVAQANNSIYGNRFLVPLIGGSGGGGALGFLVFFQWTPPYYSNNSGGGGGGAILIASSTIIQLNGTIDASSGTGIAWGSPVRGSGGAVRFLAPVVSGSGYVDVDGGSFLNASAKAGGNGRIRFDALQQSYGGTYRGSLSQGFQPIILPAAGQGTQLAIQSIGGFAVADNPNGVLANPDVVIPPQQQNPMNVVVGCSNLPLNTLITVVVRPAHGEEIVATGRNTNGSVAASTVSIPVAMPRGGGIIYAKCVSGVNGVSSTGDGSEVKNIAQTGWTADGETFAQMEIIAGLDGSQQVAYLTASGKRYALPAD